MHHTEEIIWKVHKFKVKLRHRQCIGNWSLALKIKLVKATVDLGVGLGSGSCPRGQLLNFILQTDHGLVQYFVWSPKYRVTFVVMQVIILHLNVNYDLCEGSWVGMNQSYLPLQRVSHCPLLLCRERGLTARPNHLQYCSTCSTFKQVCCQCGTITYKEKEQRIAICNSWKAEISCGRQSAQFSGLLINSTREYSIWCSTSLHCALNMIGNFPHRCLIALLASSFHL